MSLNLLEKNQSFFQQKLPELFKAMEVNKPQSVITNTKLGINVVNADQSTWYPSDAIQDTKKQLHDFKNKPIRIIFGKPLIETKEKFLKDTFVDEKKDLDDPIVPDGFIMGVIPYWSWDKIFWKPFYIYDFFANLIKRYILWGKQ